MGGFKIFPKIYFAYLLFRHFCQPKEEVIMGSFLKKNMNVDIGNDIQPKTKANKAKKTVGKPKGCADIREMFKKAEERNKVTTIEID